MSTGSCSPANINRLLEPWGIKQTLEMKMDIDGGPVIAWETDHAEGRVPQRPSPRLPVPVCLPMLQVSPRGPPPPGLQTSLRVQLLGKWKTSFGASQVASKAEPARSPVGEQR